MSFRRLGWAPFAAPCPIPPFTEALLAPEKPPTLREAIYMVGGIGGHLGRKSDGFPGTQTLWRGLQRLDTATEMYAILTQQDPPHPMQSGP
jgi:hypothetical protein